MSASLKRALSYTAAFAAALLIHFGLAVAAGGFSGSRENRNAQTESAAQEQPLTLTFRRLEPVPLQTQPAAAVTRVREPLPVPTSNPGPVPEESATEDPKPVTPPSISEPPIRGPEAENPEEPAVYSSIVPRSSAIQRQSLSPKATVPIEKPRPLQPIDAQAVYPLGARLRGEEGTVRLMIRVGGDGRVEAVEIRQSSGFTTLDRAAERALRRTRFAPATRNSQPVTEELTITISFHLDS